MTQEDKQLLLKDLCARLPYGVKIACGQYDNNPRNVNSISIVDIGTFLNGYFNKGIQLDFNGNKELWPKPYLRPMSSMTEEEKREFSIFIGKTETYRQQICLDSDSMCNPIIGGYKCVYWGLFDKCIDWLNRHHFDYRGLIEKGLALEAPEGMYNIK